MMPDTAMRPKTICYVVSKLGVGGAEKNILLLAQHLPKDRYAPVVLSLNGEGAYAGRMRAAGVPVYSLGFPHPRFIPRMVRFFFRCSFDLFHGFMFHGNVAARLFAALFGKPAISAVRVAEGEKRWHVQIDRWTSRWVDRYTTNSAALSEFVAQRLNVHPEKIACIPNALSEEDVRPPEDSPAARKKLGLPETGALMAMVGRLHIQKDPETFVRAAALVAKEEGGAHFLIAGIGPLREKVARLIQTLNLAGRFHLAGLVDARLVYAACDLFVLPSRWEGFPNAAIEAMAAGRACVLADFPGASEVIDYGVTGLVVPREDDRALAEAIVGLLRDQDLRTRMGRAAHDTVLSRYTVARLVEANAAIYEQLTRNAGAL